MSDRRESRGFTDVVRPLVATVAAFVLLVVSAPGTSGATAKIWLYPDSQDPNAGGHVVTEPAFTLKIENRGTGNGDNTAYESVLLVAVNDPSVFVDATVTLPGSTTTLDPASLAMGSPVFECSGGGLPPHGVYPAFFAEIPVGDIAQGEIVAAGVVVNGSEGLEVHFDLKAVGYRQAGPNVKCYDVVNPSGHDVTVRFEGTSEPPCHEVAIFKTADATAVALDDPMDYTITVENTGTCELTDVVLTEDLPVVLDLQGDPVPAFTITGIDPPPTHQTETLVEWTVGGLDPGAVFTAVISVVFDQPAAAGQTVVNTACVSSFELPDPVCSSVSVGVEVNGEEEIGGAGFWCNQLRFAREGRPNAKFTTSELDEWLLQVFDESAVFPEVYPLVTLVDAEELLCRPNTLFAVADRLARHLLAMWFNIASERLPLDTVLGDLCPGSEEPPEEMDPAMTVAELVSAVEADMVAAAPDEVLGVWLEIVDYVNNSHLPGEGGCEEQYVRRAGGRRNGRHRP